MIVHQEPIPPIWRPIARFLHWRKRRARKRAVLDFSSYLMPIIRSPFPTVRVADIAEVQKTIEEQMSDESVIAWNVIHRRTRWYSRLWRWAKGSNETGCCQ